MKKTLQKILISVGGLGIIWFVLPLLLYGILSVGNLTGFAIFLLILFYGLKLEKVNEKIKNFRTKKSGKFVVSVVLVFAIAVVGLAGFETALMISSASGTPEPDSTVVILGCKANGENPSRMLLRRLQAAKKFLDKNPEAVCIVAGGQGADETISEAECMYKWLVKNGIDESRLYMEDKSTNTRENLQLAKEIIQRENLNEKITIVTNEFHQYRSGRIADALGLEHSAVNGMTPIVLFPTYYVRELYSILYEWVR